jgi:hypothetical protein
VQSASQFKSGEEVLLVPGLTLRVLRAAFEKRVNRLVIDLRSARRLQRVNRVSARSSPAEAIPLVEVPAFQQVVPPFPPAQIRDVASFPDMSDARLATLAEGTAGELERRFLGQFNSIQRGAVPDRRTASCVE